MSIRRGRLRLPEGFEVPAGLETRHFHLAPLSEAHTERDYEAVMETRERLRRHAPNGWPAEGFTLAENTSDLIRHAEEFEARIAFAYTVLSTDASRVLGCIYINPPEPEQAQSNATDRTANTPDGGRTGVADNTADVHMWVRESEHPGGLAQELYGTVKTWLRESWPFAHINYVRTPYYRLQGGCLCGAVRFEVDEVTGPFELCHCSRCRKASGSGFVAGIGVSNVWYHGGASDVTVMQLPVREEPPAYHTSFCRHCGSPVPDPSHGGPQEVAAGSLEGLTMTPDRHIYVEHQAAWCPINDDLPRFTREEIREFRARQKTQPDVD